MYKRRDFVAPVMLALAATFFLYKAFKLPGSPDPRQPSPGLFPKIVLFAILFASLFLIYQELKTNRKSLPIKLDLRSSDTKKTLFILILSIIYVILLGKVSFILITCAFLIIAMQTLTSGAFPHVLIELRKTPLIVFISLLVCGAVYFVFAVFLNIPLP